MSKTMRVLIVLLIVFGLAAIGINVYFNFFAPKALKVKKKVNTLEISVPKETSLAQKT